MNLSEKSELLIGKEYEKEFSNKAEYPYPRSEGSNLFVFLARIFNPSSLQETRAKYYSPGT